MHLNKNENAWSGNVVTRRVRLRAREPKKTKKRPDPAISLFTPHYAIVAHIISAVNTPSCSALAPHSPHLISPPLLCKIDSQNAFNWQMVTWKSRFPVGMASTHASPFLPSAFCGQLTLWRMGRPVTSPLCRLWFRPHFANSSLWLSFSYAPHFMCYVRQSPSFESGLERPAYPKPRNSTLLRILPIAAN